MPPKTPTVGGPIKGRLSDKYRTSLSVSDQVIARKIIGQLKRTDTKKQPRGAKGNIRIPSGSYEVVIGNGKIRINGRWRTLITTGDKKVSDVVAEAVSRGYFRKEGDERQDGELHEHDGPTPDGDGNDEGDTEGDGDGDGQGEGDSEGESDSDGEGEGEEGDGEAEAEIEPPPPEWNVPEGNEWEKLKQRLAEIREYLDSDTAEHADNVSNRPYLDGARMIAKGMPHQAVLHAWAINWPETARDAVGIETYDPADFGKKPGRHELYPYIRALVEANVPVFLKGPTQAGKSYVLSEIAKDMGFPFRVCPLTGGASSSWLLGAWTPKGFVEAGFPQVYGGGGIFLFDEVDAADPNMLIVLNNAVSNDTLENPRNGEVVRRSSLFRAVCAANTWGTGATADYTGRARMDAATLERFRCGRIEVGYDTDLQVELGDATFTAALEGQV